MGEITVKTWGTRERIIELNQCIVDRLVIKPGGYCSTHHHLYKTNLLKVELGELEVYIYPPEYEDNARLHMLGIGNEIIIHPKELHYFHNQMGIYAFVYEISYVQTTIVKEDDIIRTNTGGIK